MITHTNNSPVNNSSTSWERIFKLFNKNRKINTNNNRLLKPSFTRNLLAKSSKGFSLIELMIVLTILSILTAIAVPTYHSYIKKARFSEIINNIGPYKLGVSLCYQSALSLKDCNGGSNDVPKDIGDDNNEKYPLIKSITVSKGIIKVTPKTVNGFTSKDTYILTPEANDQSITWKSSGGAVEAGYAK